MKLLNEFMGFVVLTGPLFLLIAWLPFCIWIAMKVAKRFQHGGAKLGSGLGVFLLLFMLPFADGIVGHLYLNHLCDTKAVVRVYQTVELPAELLDEGGRPNFRDKNGKFYLGKYYSIKYKTGTYSSIFHVDNSGYSLVNIQSGQVLGEVTDFRYWGGWIRREFSPHNTANSCGYDNERFNQLITQTLVQTSRR